MSDPQKLSDLKKRRDKMDELYKELLDKRVQDLRVHDLRLRVDAADIVLALDFDSAMKPFPSDFDPLRRAHSLLAALNKRVREEEEKP